jgi:hypothetical protein
VRVARGLDDLRERLLTPAGARAVTHPAAIIGAGAAAAATIATGLALPLAPVAAAAAWGVIAASRLPRSRRARTADLRDLGEPWRRYLVEAVAARQRFDTAVDQCEPGPLRRRLEQVGRRVEDGVAAVDRIARHGSRLDRAIRQLEDPDVLRLRLGEARAAEELAPATVEALSSQLAATERIVRLAVETRHRLEVLDAQLDESVARVVELSLRQGDRAEVGRLGSEVDDLGGEVDDLVTEMETLCVALDESRAGAG